MFSRRILALAAAGLLSSLGACSFEHIAVVDYDSTIPTLDSGGSSYAVRGYVHAEAWTPAFFYVFPLMPSQDLEKAKHMAVEKARSIGADRIADIQVHVESHMPFFWIAGWTEHHISATAVSSNSGM